MTKKNTLLYFLTTLFLYSAVAVAKDAEFRIAVDKGKTTVGDAVRLSIIFDGVKNAPAQDLSLPRGLQARYLGPSTRISVINGVVSSSVTHRYILIPLKAGAFQVGPFTANVGGSNLHSNAITIAVSEKGGTGAQQQNGSVAPDAADPKESIFLEIAPEKNKLYLNESIAVVVKLYAAGLSLKDIQPPALSAEGFTVENYEEPRQSQEIINGILYHTVEFKTRIFATRTGELKIGPALLECSLLVKNDQGTPSPTFDSLFRDDFFGDFFGMYKSYPLKLKAEEVAIAVLALPEENKPAEFTGAVGDFTLTATVEPRNIRPGDPVTLKTRVGGYGNIHSVAFPKLENEEGLKVYPPQIKDEGNKRNFEQIILIQRDNIKEIPKVHFTFFNPTLQKYQRTAIGPFPVILETSLPGQSLQKLIEPQDTAQVSAGREEFGKDITFIKDPPGMFRYLPGDARLWRFLYPCGFMFCLFAALCAIHKRDSKIASDIMLARRLRAPRQARKNIQHIKKLLEDKKGEEFYNAVHSAVREYLGDRFHLASLSITEDVAGKICENAAAPEGIRKQVMHIFRESDRVRYSPQDADAETMRTTFRNLCFLIDYFEKTKTTHDKTS